MTIKFRAVWFQNIGKLEFGCPAFTHTGRTAWTLLFLNFRSIVMVL